MVFSKHAIWNCNKMTKVSSSAQEVQSCKREEGKDSGHCFIYLLKSNWGAPCWVFIMSKSTYKPGFFSLFMITNGCHLWPTNFLSYQPQSTSYITLIHQPNYKCSSIWGIRNNGVRMMTSISYSCGVIWRTHWIQRLASSSLSLLCSSEILTASKSCTVTVLRF